MKLISRGWLFLGGHQLSVFFWKMHLPFLREGAYFQTFTLFYVFWSWERYRFCNIFWFSVLRIITKFHFTSNINPLSAKPIKWSNTLKQFVGKTAANELFEVYLTTFHLICEAEFGSYSFRIWLWRCFCILVISNNKFHTFPHTLFQISKISDFGNFLLIAAIFYGISFRKGKRWVSFRKSFQMILFKVPGF